MKTIKQVIIILILVSFGMSNVQSQNFLAKKVAKLKNNYSRNNKDIDDLFTINKGSRMSKELLQDLNKGEFLNIDKSRMNSIIESSSNFISIKVPTFEGEEDVVLDLFKVDKYILNIQTSSGEQLTDVYPKMIHYQGVVRNEEENSLVTLSVFENEIVGLISTQSKGVYNIEKLKSNNMHVLYKSQDLKKGMSFNCGTIDDESLIHTKEELFSNPSSRLQKRCVRFYYETEFDIYVALKYKRIDVLNFVLAHHTQVSAIYYNDGIIIDKAAVIKIWDREDPYVGGDSGSSAETLLEFQNAEKELDGARFGQLLTFRPIGGGLAATTANALCDDNENNRMSVSGLGNGTVNLPAYSWNTMVIAHEFGHLFGLRHTHACVWNGNGSAIDNCGSWFWESIGTPPENIEGGECYDRSNPIFPPQGGTIMSYCHNTSVGINFHNGFHEQVGNIVRSNVNRGLCLFTCDTCLNSITIVKDVTGLNFKSAKSSVEAFNTIRSGGHAYYSSGGVLKLKPGFHAENNSYFKGTTGGCTPDSFDDTLGDEINDLDNVSHNIKIYPNPTKGILNIKFADNNTAIIKIDVHDILGRSIYSSQEQPEGQDLKLDLSQHPNGMYLLNIKVGGQTYRSKVIISK